MTFVRAIQKYTEESDDTAPSVKKRRLKNEKDSFLDLISDDNCIVWMQHGFRY